MVAPFIAFISPGGGEFLLIMLVLILLFGSKDAPRIFRSIHSTLDKIQRAAAGFRYKIMYGDLHAGTTDEAPYDVDAEDEGFACEGDEIPEEEPFDSDPETPAQTAAYPEPEPAGAEPGTENGKTTS